VKNFQLCLFFRCYRRVYSQVSPLPNRVELQNAKLQSLQVPPHDLDLEANPQMMDMEFWSALFTLAHPSHACGA
jgi:hypothetical protein